METTSLVGMYLVKLAVDVKEEIDHRRPQTRKGCIKTGFKPFFFVLGDFVGAMNIDIVAFWGE